MYQLPQVAPMSELQLLHKAHEIWLKFVRAVGPEYILNHGVDFDELYDSVVYPEYEIELVRNENLGVDDEGTRILGKFLPKDNTALVDKKLFETEDPRRVFTQCHEVLGHGILHGPFLRKNAHKYARLYSTEKAVGLAQSTFDWKKFNTFEWQANTFAANVITPKNYIWCLCIKLFGMKHKINYIGPTKYCLYFNGKDSFVNVGSPYQLAWQIAKRMKGYFWGLSTESLSYSVLDIAIYTNGYNNRDFGRCTFASPIGKVPNRL